MRTRLNRQIKSIADATKFLDELISNGEHYHPEDSAKDIIWLNCDPSIYEIGKLDLLMQQIYQLKEVQNGTFCPCEHILKATA